jgi:ABC-type Fe3+-hydroxamate transport system substrate-binding protein
MRICSLLPGATEIAFALGLGDELVGVTHECDYPAEARHKLVVVRSLIDSNRMTSIEIDHWVTGRLRNHQALYVIDEELLRQSAPDVILMPCGFDIKRTVKEATILEQLEGWHDLPAVKTGRFSAVNGHAFFSRPGPRLVDGLELLAHIIHPGIFPLQKSADALQRIA